MPTIDIEAARMTLQHMRRQLLHQRGDHLAEDDRLLEEPELDPLDQAATQRDVAVLDRLADEEVRRLRAIDAALARLDAGTYGVCARCGEEIPAGRLTALPEAPLCLACSGRR